MSSNQVEKQGDGATTATPSPIGASVAAPVGVARILLITGMSGAGKSSALKSLEDMGFEAVDNLPLSLLSALVHPEREIDHPLAIGVDIRTRDFAVDEFIATMDRLRAESGHRAALFFMDCDNEVLRRRFTATRRRHPLAADRPVTDGIRRERALLARLRRRADVVIDTTGYQPADLRRTLEAHCGAEAGAELTIFVTSFSYRSGLPREADLVFDVRFLSNPYYEPALKPLSGRDGPVGDYIAADPGFESFFASLTGMLAALLPRYGAEGKHYLTIAIGCTGGRHRSVYVAERLIEWLGVQGRRASLHHRDLVR